jgi:two-component system nitrogen regulation response regulator GlnG
MAAGREIHVDDLPAELRDIDDAGVASSDWDAALARWAGEQLAVHQPGSTPLLDIALPRFERIMIDAALARTGGRRRDASELLGWGRNTLTRKIKELAMFAPGDDDA